MLEASHRYFHHAVALANLMTWNTAVVNVPRGGAKIVAVGDHMACPG